MINCLFFIKHLGPRWLPFIGCFPRFYQLRSKYGYVHLAIQDLAEKYGSVLGIKLGKQRIVVVSTHELIKKVLTQDEFNGRPDGFFFRVRAFGERRGRDDYTYNTYCNAERWKLLRSTGDLVTANCDLSIVYPPQIRRFSFSLLNSLNTRATGSYNP